MAEHHEHAKAVLTQAAASIPSPPPSIALNPLLARGKLKKAKGGSKKKTTTLKDVKKAKAEELGVISQTETGGEVDPAEQGEVLDLADQLLLQLGGDDDEEQQPAQAIPIGGAPSSSTAAKPIGPPAASPSSSSARERLHELKEDFKDAFLPNRNTDGNGEKKVNRQQARKVRFFAFPPPSLFLLPALPALTFLLPRSSGKRTTSRSNGKKHTPRLRRRTTSRSRLSAMRLMLSVGSTRFTSRRSSRMVTGALHLSLSFSRTLNLTRSSLCSMYSSIADQANLLKLTVRLPSFFPIPLTDLPRSADQPGNVRRYAPSRRRLHADTPGRLPPVLAEHTGPGELDERGGVFEVL